MRAFICHQKFYHYPQECQRVANMCVMQMYNRGTSRGHSLSMCGPYMDLLNEDARHSVVSRRKYVFFIDSLKLIVYALFLRCSDV
jgi:hypothetical protein